MALIDQRDGVLALAAAAPIDHLAAIGIANPFIEGERAGEDFEVAQMGGVEHGFGHVVEHLAVHGMDHKARAELQSGLARNLDAAELNVQLRRLADEPLADFHDLRHRHRQSDALGYARGHPLVGQYTRVLRIILKLDDIKIAVGGAHEVRLRASTHAPHVLVDEDRQIPDPPLSYRKSGPVYQ